MERLDDECAEAEQDWAGELGGQVMLLLERNSKRLRGG